MKLPNGYGAVIKLSGKRRKPYAARVTLSWTEGGKQVRKYLGCYKTRQEALKALADYNENPYDLIVREITFAELYERWCKYKFKDEPVKSVYVAAYKNLSSLHGMKFAEIRKRHIQGVIDDCSLGWQAKSHMKSLCGQLFKYAIDLEIVTTNFATLVELPPHEQSEIHKPFSEEELEILWANTDDFVVRLVLILCYTGLRPKELLEMKTADVNLEGRYMKGGVKTAAGKNRVIPIADKIYPFISELYDSANTFLVSDKTGKNMNYGHFHNMLWKRNTILNLLTAKHLPHDGRHTCATLLDNAEVPLKIRQLILGHSSSDITSRVYTHKTFQQLFDAINRI